MKVRRDMTGRASPLSRARGRPAPRVALALAALLPPAASLALLAPAALTAQEAVLPPRITVEDAIRIALERSPDLRSAEAVANAAGASQRAAWGAFLPTAGVSASLSRSDFTRTTFTGEDGTSQTLPEPLVSGSQSTNQGFNLSWTVFDQGRRFSTLRQRSADVRAAQRGLDDRRAAVRAAAARAYYEALRGQRLLELTERQIADRRQELNIAQRRYEIAAVERIDVLAAESNLLDAQIGLATGRRQAESALRSLAVALGLPPDAGPGTELVDIETLPELGPVAVDQVIADALASDPELLQYEAQRAAASAGLWSARSGYLPRITASLGWSRSQSFGLSEPFFQLDPSDHGRSFSLSASWTLFDGFQREEQNAQASAQKRQAEEDLRRRRLEIERDVRGFLDELGQLSRTLELAERSLTIAQERLAMTRQMYQNGTIDFTALQQAISGVTGSERQLIALRYDYLIAWTNLREFGGDGR